ncbi:hypothetical protein BX616_003431 [Lobosporangium transversale]|nr:hypothetical protein BX616_003431 [Lobosporangium transversale]
MSDNSTDNTHNALLHEINTLRQQVAALTQANPSSSSPSPITIDRPQAKILVLSDTLKAAVPSLDGSHFFRPPDNSGDDNILTEYVLYPKNPDQQYKAPSLELPWPQETTSFQRVDKWLSQLQERQAHATRPLDEFLAEYFHKVHDPALRQIVADFGHVMRSLTLARSYALSTHTSLTWTDCLVLPLSHLIQRAQQGALYF